MANFHLETKLRGGGAVAAFGKYQRPAARQMHVNRDPSLFLCAFSEAERQLLAGSRC